MTIKLKARGKAMAQLAQVFKALSDENRLAIFELIRQGCGQRCCQVIDGRVNCVSDVAKHFDLSLSTVSHHIKELKNVGLVTCERRGRWIYCSADDRVLEWVKGFLTRR